MNRLGCTVGNAISDFRYWSWRACRPLTPEVARYDNLGLHPEWLDRWLLAVQRRCWRV